MSKEIPTPLLFSPAVFVLGRTMMAVVPTFSRRRTALVGDPHNEERKKTALAEARANY